MGDEEWHRQIIVIIGLSPLTGFHLYCQQHTGSVEGVMQLQVATGHCVQDDNRKLVGEA